MGEIIHLNEDRTNQTSYAVPENIRAIIRSTDPNLKARGIYPANRNLSWLNMVHPSGKELSYDNSAKVFSVKPELRTNEEQEPHPSHEEGDDNKMNDNNFDTLFKELKDDMRERENRTRHEIEEREKRFESTIDRYHEDNKDRETRIMEAINGLKEDIKSNNSSLQEDFKEVKDDVKDRNKDIRVLSMTTLISVVGIAVTVFLSVN